MLALIAALIFILAAFGVTIGEVNLVALGLCVLALHFVWSWGAPLVRRTRK